MVKIALILVTNTYVAFLRRFTSSYRIILCFRQRYKGYALTLIITAIVDRHECMTQHTT